jgi:signal peptidase
MRPSIEPGSLLVTRPVPVTDVHPGDVIVFSAPGHVGSFVHRVVSVTPGSAGPIVQTRGDANGQVDPWRAQLVARNVPEVVTAVPWVGRLATSGQRWIPMAVLMACGLAVTGLGARMVLRGGSATPATVA